MREKIMNKNSDNSQLRLPFFSFIVYILYPHFRTKTTVCSYIVIWPFGPYIRGLEDYVYVNWTVFALPTHVSFLIQTGFVPCMSITCIAI